MSLWVNYGGKITKRSFALSIIPVTPMLMAEIKNTVVKQNLWKLYIELFSK